ncbi:OX-2 membrane glycoprotein-like protein, partial [Lates japonicus]
MTRGVAVLLLFVRGIIHEGLTALIQTQQTVVAAVGEEAHLTCQLTQSKDVLQRTTCSNSNTDCHWPHTSHHNTVRVNNTNGTVTVTTTAELARFHDNSTEVGCAVRVLSVQKECSDDSWLKQTSADGSDQKPGSDLRNYIWPLIEVTWQKTVQDREINFATFNNFFGQKVNPDFTDRVEIKDAGLQSSSIVIRELMEQDEGCYLCLFNSHPDGALWVEPAQLYAELARFHDNSTEVGCAVRVLSVQKEVFLMIPELKQTSADGSDQKSGSDHRNYIGT